MLVASDQRLCRFPRSGRGLSPQSSPNLGGIVVQPPLMSLQIPGPPHAQPRHALDFDCGVRAYPPTHPDGYWRLRWIEADRRRETTATSKDEVLARAADVVERLAQGRPTDWAQAKGGALVAHYLDPTRRPARGRAWSLRHREEQQAYCERFVTPVITDVELARLSRVHFARILAQATTASVAAHLRRCCSAMVAAGLEEGLLLARQDVLRGVHWTPGPKSPGTTSSDLATSSRRPTSPPPQPSPHWRRPRRNVRSVVA